MNPYLVLDVPLDATADVIRQAYLQAIKASPPDTHPDRFQLVNQAYETIKHETGRLQYFLFNTGRSGESPLEAVVNDARLQGPPRPLAWEPLQSYLRHCASP
jgi:curved DNA-binding protein CbpA